MSSLRIGLGNDESPLRQAVARLVAAVMVADGRLTSAELDAAGRLDRAGFGPLVSLVNAELERAIRGPLDIGPACAQLRGSGPAVAGGVLAMLSRVAASDGVVAPVEEELLTGIASLLGIEGLEDAAPVAPPVPASARPSDMRESDSERAQALRALGLDAEATPDQVAAAYLGLVERFDPLKVAPLGMEFVVLAVRKLAQLTAAYEAAVS